MSFHPRAPATSEASGSRERGAKRPSRRPAPSPGPAARTAAAAFFLLPAAAPAAAQDLPEGGFTEPGATEEDLGWGGTADFGLTVTSGNSETTNLSIGARATRVFLRHRISFSGTYLRTTEDGEEVANRGELATSYRYYPDRRFYFTTRTSGSFNEPAGLELRLAPGAGAGYLLAEGDNYQLSAEAGATWIRDSFVDGSTANSFYYALAQSFSLNVNETTTLEQGLRYNPKADDLSDYLLHGEVTLTTRITDAVALRLTFIDDFDATPFEGAPGEPAAEKNDITFITGVSFSW